MNPYVLVYPMAAMVLLTFVVFVRMAVYGASWVVPIVMWGLLVAGVAGN